MIPQTDAPDAQNTLSHLEALKEEHRELDVQITTLDAKPWLSPDEQIEMARLKKLKLRKKDEIFTISTSLGLEP
jgi:uncharacterized protein YdcH (DUF465 family)